jgi:hypothetical protein
MSILRHDPFYVVAGSTPVLVHNDDDPECGPTINPATVRFSQKGVSPTFKNGNTLEETVAALTDPANPLSASDFPPIRLVENDGNMYTLDNRRLVAFQQAGLTEVPYAMATPEEVLKESWKFDPGTDGTSIKIRGGGGVWTPPAPPGTQ